MKKWNIEQIIGVFMLLFAIGFNLWLYRLEPSATIDPNDNTFQFALVDRTNTIWDYATKKCTINPVCHFAYMADHWVPNWAEGYNLPYYYSHIPQIAIVGSWRFFHVFTNQLSLFQYYHIVIYLLLCFVPLPVFFALRVMGLPWLTAGIGALFATHLSTDGLYGLDPSSFLWRGYGLSSQLFAFVWLPLAIAYSFRYFTQSTKPKRLDLLLAVFFVTATTAGHLGIGMITMLSIGFMAIATPIVKFLRQETLGDIVQSGKDQCIRLFLVAGLSIFLLGYWIVPTFLHDNFHNISFWDPVWKFDSYGAKETMIRLFNGDLFDFGRLPYLTILIFIGIFAGLRTPQYSTFSILFIFWLLMYFGRTTWGSIIDIIPGMKDFHLSRFLVGLHVTGMLLAPIGFSYLADRITNYGLRFSKFPYIRLFVYLLICLLLIPNIYKWTLTYNELNDKLIVQANVNRAKTKADEDKLFAKLRSLPPARIFAGRGGGYGKKFEVAETPYFMHLSTYGLSTTLWLPETWSMNSDTEQYFSENQQKDYDLYNQRWVAAPPDEKPQDFWNLIDQADTWKLYEVKTTGYFTTGIRPAVVSVDKRSFINVVHLWIQSDAHKLGLYPELTFDKNYPKTTGLANFKMIDEVTYQVPDKSIHNIWTDKPIYLPPGVMSQEAFNTIKPDDYVPMKLIGPESVDTDMIYKTKVEVGKNCVECLVILKQTFHPNWRATVDGSAVKPIIVFPFYIGIPVTEGTHEIVASYEPSSLKVGLLILTFLVVAGGVTTYIKRGG
jgi:hypothetical protein